MSENKQQAQEITLTLGSIDTEQVQEAALGTSEEVKQVSIEKLYEDAKLSEAERKTVDEFSKQIDVTSVDTILNYGAGAQQKINSFSDTALKSVRTKDLGEVGKLLGNLVSELKQNNTKEDKGFFSKLFSKPKKEIENIRIKWADAEQNVEKVADALEDHQIVLLKDVALLDQLYERNAQNTKELSMYIIAGKKRLQEIREEELPKLVKKAQDSSLPEDAQAANDLAQCCDRFEKKLYDLELTRQISIQMAPQIRLVQNNDTLMVEKIQSTLVNTIPLWKNQIVLTLGIEHSKEALEAQREVSNATNDLLKKNAETLHMATVETAKEAERGIVDIETLQHTNEELIKSLDEVLAIQKEGHQKRIAAEAELSRIEDELVTKMVQIQDDANVVRKKR